MTANLIASNVRRLHQLPGLDDIPEYNDALKALAAVQEALKAHGPAVDDSLEQIADDLAAAARAGDPLNLDDATTRVVDLERRKAAAGQVRTALVNAERDLLSEVDTLASRAIPRLIAGLSHGLRTALEQLTAIADPSQLIDADTAIHYGRTDDYTTRRNLIAEQIRIRGAQAVIYENAGITSHHQAALLLRDQEKLMPAGGWIAAQDTRTWRNHHGELCHNDPAPWPTVDAPNITGVLTSAAWLDWILDHPAAIAHAWIPTAAELDAETRRLDDLIATVNPVVSLEPHSRTITV